MNGPDYPFRVVLTAEPLDARKEAGASIVRRVGEQHAHTGRNGQCVRAGASARDRDQISDLGPRLTGY